jgi:hypothetical protein
MDLVAKNFNNAINKQLLLKKKLITIHIMYHIVIMKTMIFFS